MSKRSLAKQPAAEPGKPATMVERRGRSRAAAPPKAPACEFVDGVRIVELDRGQASENPDHDWGDPFGRHRFDKFYARFVKSRASGAMHAILGRSTVPPERHHGRGGKLASRNLASAGELVWLVAAPAVAGLFLGRWLDIATAVNGLPWMGAGLLLGTAMGAWLAWRWVRVT